MQSRSKLQQYKSSGGGHVPPGAASSQTTWRVSRTVRRHAPQNHQRCRHRLAESLMPPGASVPVLLYFGNYCLAKLFLPPGAASSKPLYSDIFSPGEA
ncbi:hypothetical protein DEO72_LG7g1628 [Vigna unguiculata]|uniref:Uncharacterized protein n=1 Tax=Vigna unguiculata TaxID=3917 RepID=A0A4D6MH47_VIGUN|nr:hypothetical protein DEO72_LG7g1628 [Vigna unguiculata]